MPQSHIIAGIDVGSSKTATVIASLADGEEKMKIIGASSVPSRGIRKGQIVNIEEAAESVIDSVEAAERMAGYSLSRLVVSVGGPHLSSQNSRGVVAVAEPESEITTKDITRVIEAAKAISLPSLREVIHVIPRNFIVDGQEGIKDPVGMSGVRLEVETHIVTGSSTAIKNLTKCVSEIGSNIQSLVAVGLASAESVLTETEKELGVILVDIGGGTTNVAIFIEGSPFYTAVLPVGAKNVTNDLAIGLRLSLEVAEKIKLALSEKEKQVAKPQELEEEEEKQDKEKTDEINLADLGIYEETKVISRKTLIEGIIKPRLNEIFTMVGLEIKKSGAAGLTPAGVVICGGGAQTVGAIEAAKKILAMAVRIGVPSGMSGLIDDVQSPEFATAIGLLFYGFKEGKTSTGKKFPNIPIKGAAGKIIGWVKSFLP